MVTKAKGDMDFAVQKEVETVPSPPGRTGMVFSFCYEVLWEEDMFF